MQRLDNPIWAALTGAQSHLSVASASAEPALSARRFQRELTTLAAFSQPTPESYRSLASLASPGETLGMFSTDLDDKQIGSDWELVSSLPILQMVSTSVPKLSATKVSTEPLLELSAKDSAEMLSLAELTRPGPFGTRTHELGTYLGIRLNGVLVAMTGERLFLGDYREISAVCTHPDHTGHGYAAALLNEVAARIRKRNEIPFLHVRPDNLRAIQLYERLGFQSRTLVQLLIIRRR